MGLLDWLTDLGGSSGSTGSQGANPMPSNNPFISATNNYSGPGGQPAYQMPPVQQTGSDAPPLPQGMAQRTETPITTPPEQLTAQSPLPFPGAGGLPPGPTPQNAQAQPPGPPSSLSPQDAAGIYRNYQAAGGGQPIGNNPGPGRGFFGQAFGMNSADEKNMLGSLGAGLTSVGQNWNKPGLAAFAGSAGAAIEGGTKAEEKRIDEMLKLVAAKRKAGDDSSASSLAQVKLETAKLQLQNLKDNNGKSGAWNKPPTQLYQDAIRLANANRDVVASQKELEQTIKDGNPEAIAKKKAEHNALYQAVRNKELMGVKLPPETAAAMEKMPGLTETNPIPQAAFNGKSFDQVVKPNQSHDQYFMDEKGQMRVLRAAKSGDAAKAPSPPPIPSNPDDTTNQEEE